MKKPSVYDEELSYKKGNEESKWNSYLNLSNLEISSQEKGSCSLDFVEENNDISFETFGRNQNLDFDILNEIFDVSFENCHENSVQDSLEDQFGKVLDELHFDQHDYGKQMIEKYKSCHGLCDPMTEYMERIYIKDDWLCVCNKDQIFYNILLPLCSYVQISTKHEEKSIFLD